MMNNKKNRMETLKANGVDTNKYFNIPSDLKAGDKFEVQIDSNGNHIIVKCKDSEPDHIMENIIESGYVRNSKLHRRFVMAQMFRALGYYNSWTGETGFAGYVRSKGYDYSINMMIEEARVLSKLEAKDKETFEERKCFFTKNVIAEVLEHYIVNLKKYIDGLKSYNCKGIPYKKIKGNNIFVEDLDKKVYEPMRKEINYIRYTNTYSKMYSRLLAFKRMMITIPWDSEISPVFMDAYKGAGAYYTLKNMVMFHDCSIKGFKGVAGVHVLNQLREDFKGEGWRMMGVLKEVIRDNNFDFKLSCREHNNR